MPELVSKEVELLGEPGLLALAAWDMRQTAAAAKLLQAVRDDILAVRALETAIAVCYWRPFNKSNNTGTLRDRWRPRDEEGRRIHALLKRLRNELYAHTDPPGGRRPTVTMFVDTAGRVANFAVGETWHIHLVPDDFPSIIKTCEEQAERFKKAAFEGARSLVPSNVS